MKGSKTSGDKSKDEDSIYFALTAIPRDLKAWYSQGQHRPKSLTPYGESNPLVEDGNQDHEETNDALVTFLSGADSDHPINQKNPQSRQDMVRCIMTEMEQQEDSAEQTTYEVLAGRSHAANRVKFQTRENEEELVRQPFSIDAVYDSSDTVPQEHD